MGLKETIKATLKEAELYKSQGLLNEARQKYNKVAQLIENNAQIPNSKSLLDSVKKKMKALDDSHLRVVSAPTTPVMSEKAQNLIKELFTFSKDSDKASLALEGAISLAKFGQYHRAIEEFKKLLSDENVRIAAAKNIIKCYYEFVSIDKAVDEYRAWKSSSLFSPVQLEKVLGFLAGLIEKSGKSFDLDKVEESAETVLMPDEAVEEILDISSVGISLEKGVKSGSEIELDVSFQAGNVISVIISSKEKELIDNLKIGVKLNNVNFYSPIAIFRGSGIISASTKIDSGPKKGDYCLDIKVTNI
ncbi:MAG: hypothetical protein KJ737_07740 [Proteobacteria bacterium]|nr:hypothetical protein [Pseudomonadota bacterium]